MCRNDGACLQHRHHLVRNLITSPRHGCCPQTRHVHRMEATLLSGFSEIRFRPNTLENRMNGCKRNNSAGPICDGIGISVATLVQPGWAESSSAYGMSAGVSRRCRAMRLCLHVGKAEDTVANLELSRFAEARQVPPDPIRDPINHLGERYHGIPKQC